MEKKSIVRIQNISKTYQAENGEVEALKGINFDVKEGEFISIIGPSGCGKSTLLSIISGSRKAVDKFSNKPFPGK